MKQITLDYNEYLDLERELKELKSKAAQTDKLVDQQLLSLTPEELQSIRSQPSHPWWSQADRQLQQRHANSLISKGQTK